MSKFIAIMAVGLLTAFSSLSLAQTSDESTETLTRLLTHRRETVRANAFQALYEQAKAGKDLSTAREELLKFANQKYQDRLSQEESEANQVFALKILVQIDAAVAQKVLTRTQQLVDAYLALDVRSDYSVKEIYGLITNGFEILRSQQDPQILGQVADMAECLLGRVKTRQVDLLRIAFLRSPQGRDRLSTLKRLDIDLSAISSPDYQKFLGGLYESQIDDETVRFIAALPESQNYSDLRVAQHAYLLGLIVLRSETAKQEALKYLRDEYESEEVRHAVSCGIVASCSTEEKIYWEADQLIESTSKGMTRHLDFGPELTEKIRKENRQRRNPSTQTTAESVVQSDIKPKENASSAKVQKDTFANAAMIRQNDSRDFQKIMVQTLREIQGEFKAGQIKISVPRKSYDRIREEEKQARAMGRPGLADMLDKLLQGWDRSIAEGRAQIVD